MTVEELDAQLRAISAAYVAKIAAATADYVGDIDALQVESLELPEHLVAAVLAAHTKLLAAQLTELEGQSAGR